jgi:hypothetical protein
MKAMKTSVRLNSGYRVRLALIVTMIILGIYSSTVKAQGSLKREYLGLVASFGNRSFSQNSSIKAIDNERYGHIGGSLGLVYGNEILKTRLNILGYYSSDNNNPRTQDIYESSVTTNFYPMELLRTNRALIHPYISAGFSRTSVKYYGTYLDGTSLTRDEEPMLGKVLHYNVLAGVGIEMRLETDRDFMHFFLEGVMEKTLSRSTLQQAFNQTTPENITSFNIGVAFGRKRF